MKGNTKRIFSLFSLGLILMLLVNYGINLHSHQLESGQIIVHAHPHQSQNSGTIPLSDHKHDKQDIQFYSALYLLFFISLFIIHLFHFQKLVIPLSLYYFNYDGVQIHLPSKRGPPALKN